MSWLHSATQDSSVKNDVLTRLLHAAGDDGKPGDLAVELLILALWPGLCTVRRRLWPMCRTGTLDADVLGEVAVSIRRARPDRVTRIAATLLRNLERDLRRLYIRDDEVARCSIDLNSVGISLTQPEADHPEAIFASAKAQLGQDGVLLTAVHIAGFTQKEAAERLGISHDAARKRCQRALARLAQEHGD